MKPVDLARKLRREAAFDPAVLDRGKAVLMAAVQRSSTRSDRPTIIPSFRISNRARSRSGHAFGFGEISTSRLVVGTA